MKTYIMDSNAPPQSRGTPLQGKSQNTKGQRGFSFARGTPVVATWQPIVNLPVIPIQVQNCHSAGSMTEESVTICQILSCETGNRVDSKNQRSARNRPLLKLRDGPSSISRGAPRWLARGTPPARGKPETEMVIRYLIPVSPPGQGGVSRPVGTRGLKTIWKTKFPKLILHLKNAAETGMINCTLPIIIVLKRRVLWRGNRIYDLLI